MRIIWIIAVAVFGSVTCTVFGAEQATPKPVGELPEVAELPDPFVFSDGLPVRTAEDWQRRRAELKRLFEDYMYGHLPPKPETMTVERGERVTDEVNGVTIQELTLNLEHDGKTLPITVQIAWPTDATEKVPVIVQGAFGRRPGQENASPPAPGERWKVFTGRGYAVAEVDFQQFAPDNRDSARAAASMRLFGDQIDCGALMAWAWGMHRVIDALQEVPEIDATKVVVTGHSRYGKAALVAGAFDERIALDCAESFRLRGGRAVSLHLRQQRTVCTTLWVSPRTGSGPTSTSSWTMSNGCRSISICSRRWSRRGRSSTPKGRKTRGRIRRVLN